MWFTILLFVDLWDDSNFTSITGNNHYSSNENKEKRYCAYCETYGLSYQELNTGTNLEPELKNGQILSDAENWIQYIAWVTIYPSEHGK